MIARLRFTLGVLMVLAIGGAVCGRERPASPAPAVPATQGEKPITVHFVAKVKKVEMISRLDLKLLPVFVVEADARFLAMLEIESVDRLDTPIKTGQTENFLIHSPAMTFGAAFDESVGKTYRLLAIWKPGQPGEFVGMVSDSRPPASQTDNPAASRPALASQPEQAAFKWFDGLGFPPLNGAKFVRVATGPWSLSGEPPSHNEYAYAFLLKSRGRTFTVFTLDLETRIFRTTATSQPESRRIGYEPGDLARAAAEILQSLPGPPPEEDEEHHLRWLNRTVNQSVDAFVLARACAAHGFERQARELYDQAAAAPDMRTGKPPPEFRALLDRDIGNVVIMRAIGQFGDRRVSRRQLLATFRRFVQHFPAHQYAAQARATADLLAQMVREDRAHVPLAAPTTATEAMLPGPRKALIAELIFQLRDQNGRQESNPGACDFFVDPRGPKSPAERLVTIGYDAVPQLIEVLGDQRFTRSLGDDFGGPWHYVLRVGDCAEAIIARIAHRRFYTPMTNGVWMVTEGKAAEKKTAIQAWWAEFQAKGEKQMLVEATTRGDDDAPLQARRLAEAYPDAAPAAIAKGIANAGGKSVGCDLVAIAAGLKGDAPLPLLRQVLSTNPSYACRAEAATALCDRGQPEALRVVIDLWLKSAAAPREEDPARPDNPASLVAVLASSGEAEAVGALGKDLAKRPVDLKLAVVSALGDSENFLVTSTGSGGLKAGEAVRGSREYRLAVEKLLVAALADTDAQEGTSGSWNGWSFTDPRICDAAAFVLCQRWPEKYKSDLNVSRTKRDRQRIRLMNIWLKEQGLALVPAPEPISIKPADPTVTTPLLKAILDAPDQAARDRAADAIEALGLPALHPVLDQLAAVKGATGAKADLEALSRRLASIVREVTVEAESVKPNDAIVKAMDAVKGKPLTPHRFIDLVLAGMQNLPADAAGVRVKAERMEDLTGVVVTVKLLRQRVHLGESQKGWDVTEIVRGDSKTLTFSVTGSVFEYALKAEAYTNFIRAAQKAIDLPPQTTIELQLTATLKD